MTIVFADIRRIILQPQSRLSACLTLDIGVGKDHPEQLSSLPYKKKKDQELSAEDRKCNKSHSKRRIVIEHTICRMKKYRIMGDIFRNRLRNYDKVSDIVSGLVNHRTLSSF